MTLPPAVRRALDVLASWLEDDPTTHEPIYDPLHVALTIVISFTVLGALFWLLWSLLVCEGGLFIKIVPFLKVLFTSKTLRDYGYEGYPYELGLFEGWVVNLVALVLGLSLLAGLWWLFDRTDPAKKTKETKS
jgi:hypothetical protein